MDENLKRLIEELRNETCPQRVLDEVSRRRQAENVPARRQWEIAVIGALAAVVLALALWRRPAGHENSDVAPVAMDSAQAAQQAEVALECLGVALRDAGNRSEEVILKTAVPPLRNGLQTAKNKIINHI